MHITNILPPAEKKAVDVILKRIEKLEDDSHDYGLIVVPEENSISVTDGYVYLELKIPQDGANTSIYDLVMEKTYAGRNDEFESEYRERGGIKIPAYYALMVSSIQQLGVVYYDKENKMLPHGLNISKSLGSRSIMIPEFQIGVKHINLPGRTTQKNLFGEDPSLTNTSTKMDFDKILKKLDPWEGRYIVGEKLTYATGYTENKMEYYLACPTSVDA